ncbi:MAG: hypothetical protein AB1898_28870 [Acidobacteriota bacterium]
MKAALDKLHYLLSLLTSEELLVLVALAVVYHLIAFALLYFLAQSSLSLRIRSLEAELDECRKNWDHRDDFWKDREEELRRILHVEKERELAQVKADYDSYVALLEQKLNRSRGRDE